MLLSAWRAPHGGGVDAEMTNGPANLGDCVDMIKVVGKGWSADVLREEGN